MQEQNSVSALPPVHVPYQQRLMQEQRLAGPPEESPATVKVYPPAPAHTIPVYLPSPEEIAAKTAAIREDWNDSEHSARYYYDLNFDHDEGYGTPVRLNAKDRPAKVGQVAVVPHTHYLHRE